MWRYFYFCLNLLWRPKGPNIIVPSKFGPMIININDQHIGRSIRVHGAWAFSEIILLRVLAEHLIARHSSIIFYDVGANIGTHTLAMATAFGEKIRVRAFEPQQAIFQMLCGTLAINNITEVDCHCALVSSQNANVFKAQMPDYQVANNFGGLEFSPIKNSDNHDLRKTDSIVGVPTVTLDSFDEPVHLIKIDVEGMEDSVLRGAETTITKCRPICLLEINKTDSNFVLKYFEQLNYKIFANSDTIVAAPKEDEEIISLIAKKPHEVGWGTRIRT